jgi:hypothetical protein
MYSPSQKVFKLGATRLFAASTAASSHANTTLSHRAGITSLLTKASQDDYGHAPGQHSVTYSQPKMAKTDRCDVSTILKVFGMRSKSPKAPNSRGPQKLWRQLTCTRSEHDLQSDGASRSKQELKCSDFQKQPDDLQTQVIACLDKTSTEQQFHASLVQEAVVLKEQLEDLTAAHTVKLE